MQILKQYSILIFSLLCIAAAQGTVNPIRPWTFLVYMAADNNLNPDADLNISQMVKSSANTNVNILVYLNIKRSGESKKTQKLIIQNGKMHQEGATTVEDSGDENTLIKAMSWAISEYPSDHLLVDLWNHGSGSLNRSMLKDRGVCYDDTTGNYLTDLKYKRAFDIIVNQYRGGKKIDIIAFDACLMADIEVAFTLQPYANYLVSSQQTVPGPGYDYTEVLSIFAHQTPDPRTFAHWLVTSYDHNYKTSGESYTLSAMDLNKLSAVVTTTNSIAQLLTSALSTNKTNSVSTVITQSADPSLCPHFDEPTYLDLYTFYTNLYLRLSKMALNPKTTLSLKAALRNGMATISHCVFANAHSNEFVKTHGMSVYFADINAGIEPSYNNLYWTAQNPQWVNFLSEYVNVLHQS